MDEITTATFPGDANVTITGIVHFVETSSQTEGKDRWTELELCALDTGAYVAFTTGATDVEGEEDRFWMSYCEDASHLIRSLLRPTRSGGKHLPAYARTALEKIGEHDEAARLALAGWDAAAKFAR